VSEVPGDERVGGYGPFHHGNTQPATPYPVTPQQAAPQQPPAPQQAAPPSQQVAYNEASYPAATYHPPAQPVRPQSAPPANDSWSLFPDGGPGSPSWQPRIVPSPKPPRKRIIGAALIGLAAGLLIFGPSGFLVGYQAAPTPPPAPKPTPSATPSLPTFQRTQLELNKRKFPSELTPIASNWMPWVTTCAKSGEPNAAPLAEDEAVRVSCNYANTSIVFIQYKTTDARDKAYAKYLAQNIDAKQMAPGVGEPATKKTTSGAVSGRYIEYAYKSRPDAAGKTVCGMWWSDDKAPIAAYVLAFWADGLGESWEPLRDLWRRYS
jgi:hypothetical protein